MCWQMTLFNTVSSAHCFASNAMGQSQIQREKRERQSERNVKRDEVVPRGSTLGEEGSEQGR